MVTEKRKIQLKEAREKFKERNPDYDDNYYEKKLKENPDYNKQRHNKRKDKMKKYKKENKEKVKAQRIIEQQVKKGLVENPKKLKCKDCLDTATEYHHPDYSKPLLILPLCHSCHIKRHRKTQNQEKGCGNDFRHGLFIWECGRNYHGKIKLCPTCQEKEK